MNTVVLGGSFGDEGKGKIVANLSTAYDFVIRFNGGPNAGHTIRYGSNKVVHHQVPSIDFSSSSAIGIIGSGTVIDINLLIKELDELSSFFGNSIRDRLVIDEEAHVITTDSVDADKNNGWIGTTGRGIGPTYAAKINRIGKRICDIDRCDLLDAGVSILPHMKIRELIEGKSLLFEGAQGVLLDLDYGTYPYVTSSRTGVNNVYDYTRVIDFTVGVIKPYVTRVGEGPFPTEIFGVDSFRAMAGEFGATTGRPRRIGVFDVPAVRYAQIRANIDGFILTKFDLMSDFLAVNNRVCCQYDINGRSSDIPMSSKDFQWAKPVYDDNPLSYSYLKNKFNIIGYSHSPDVKDIYKESGWKI